MVIRPMSGEDAEPFFVLRRSALVESPLSFSASPQDDVASSVEAARQLLTRDPDAIVLGAFDDLPAGSVPAALVGMVGLYRDRHRKEAHKVHVWGMYVVPAARGRGVGAQLLAAVLDVARAMPGVGWVHLGVTSAAPSARRLYERAGFRVWGVEPQAQRHDGHESDEFHMALSLEARS